MERKFKKGEMVKLNSGGPTMTVDRYLTDEEIEGDDFFNSGDIAVFCSWFIV